MPRPDGVRRALRYLLRTLTRPHLPPALAGRFRPIDAAGLQRVEAALRAQYFTPDDAWYADAGYLETEDGRFDLDQHLTGRLEAFRRTVVPWLSSIRPLDGARILEIGCGTGSSTVALAEQGAAVTGVDVVERSLEVARERCGAYGVMARFLCANATEVHELCAGESFDFIVFFAALEHMTHAERLASMRGTWNMLGPGGFWCVIETPNRLWYDDQHTSLLPFYHWLPDDLAFRFSRLSPRRTFSELYREMDEASTVDFLRRGRGVSYHEFGLAMANPEQLDVVSSMGVFLRGQRLVARLLYRLRRKGTFESFLRRVGPPLHRGFYQESLDLVLRKP